MRLSEQHLLELRCELEKLITEREMMVAENKDREAQNNSMAYTDKEFYEVMLKIEELKNLICHLGEK